MFCTKCGHSATDDSRFCPKCGEVTTPTATLVSPSTPLSLTGAAGSPMPSPSQPLPQGGTGLAGSSRSGTRAYGAPSPELIGHVIDHKYRLDYRIGTGGMGVVYRATRLMIGDIVAVKILHKEQVADAKAVERFRREAQAAARLKHPNAVTIYDFGVCGDGLIYLVMELVEGDNLRQIIQQQGAIAAATTAEIITQVCAALDEAHTNHIVHRDLKPDNIIARYTTNGIRVKVLDFGIARMRDVSATTGNLTQTGAVMGTPHYMSPEQCLGEELDHRSDIYSIGIVLYEMLTGTVPFNSPASTAVIIQHVNQPPPPLRSINISIAPAVEAVVLHALQKRREDRPQTAGALAREMLTASGGALSSSLLSNTGLSSILTGNAKPETAPTVHFPPPGLPHPTPPGLPQQPPVIPGQHTPQQPPGQYVSGANQYAPPTVKKNYLVPILAAAVVALALAIGVWLFLKSRQSSVQSDKPTTTAAPEIVVPVGMSYVAGGEFLMGSNDGPIAERPQHKVILNPFFIDLNEVTCEDYQKFILATARTAPLGWTGTQYPIGSARQPVMGISWDDASAYASWAGKRLPTEEEWEYAARGANNLRYPWGNDWKEGMANIETSAIGHVSDVSFHSEGKSPFGLFDMIGNAWEWTASKYEPYPGGQLDDKKPGELRVIRGGCYVSGKEQATTTFRLGSPARTEGLYSREVYSETGFRCAKDAPSSSVR